ncbi:ATP-binding cassette domain-containing protein, partial [Trinickia soli]|uniref:ATP-binding cassette domain-containing protein n=2 Tax=Trinickia soli TaxID=380675 RepID=UPI001E6223BE
MDIFIQQLINGLVLGSVYAIIALGYTMVYGIIAIINFAHADYTARNLSYGHQRRLEIARALATDPKLLALDEPAAGMNAT